VEEGESGKPPPPAQAGRVIAAEGPAAPVDFTGFDITSGGGSAYAGGVTASAGTNTEAVHADTVDLDARPDQPRGEADLSRTVSLPERNWRCPWPREAEALGIDEQDVLLRVVVDAQGRLTSVEVLGDPGHGFGEAALACARTARFAPARDRRGRPYSATSPPIRVRFSR
jgi:protein TonB